MTGTWNAASFFIFCLALFSSVAGADDDRWWPVQKRPTGIVRTKNRDLPMAQQMLMQSIAGLTAKSVNQDHSDEMVWVSTHNVDFETWYDLWLKQNPSVKFRGEFDPWELVQRYSQSGIIKGYILYALDQSPGQMNEHRKEINLSVNVATSLAGILDGVLIDESLEQEAKANGLTMLMDARDKSQKWCFETYRERFNRKLLLAQDPKKWSVRDLAITQQAFTLYGEDEPTETVLEWLEPLSPIAGWNGGDEFECTRLSSLYGHLQTATDHCMNIPVLMAGSDQVALPHQTKTFDPREINFGDHRNCLSFVISDGDNIQWLESSFFHGNPSYWDSPDRGKIPFGWSCCFAQLAQLCPVIIDYTLATQKENDRLIEWGGGYYYPDLFGHSRPNRQELLAAHAQRTWSLMKKTGTRIIGFNVAKVDSPDALKAYKTFAAETDDLLAILVFQYAPYEGGAGATYWVKDRHGIEIPVISCRYSIWEHANTRPRAGTPIRVAQESQGGAFGAASRLDWVIVHAWSYFRRAAGDDENAENMPQENAASEGGIRGYTPAVWCAERLPKDIRVVTPEELCWRIRMRHDAASTKKLIESFQAP